MMKFSDMTCVFLLLIIWAQNFQQMQQTNTTLQRVARTSCTRTPSRSETR